MGWLEMKSHELKLERAREHLISLQTRIQAFLDSDPYDQIAQQYQRPAETILVVLHLKKRFELPVVLPLIVGDTIYNMRSALDHLAYGLAAAHASATGRSLDVDLVNFPLHIDGGAFSEKGAGTRAISQMSPDVQRIIKAMQPHLAGDKAGEHPLGVLNKLSNMDKHRHLVFTGYAEIAQQITLLPESQDCEIVGLSSEVRIGPFDDHTDVARVLIRVTGPKPQPKLDTYITIDISFPETGPAAGKLVLKELERLYLHIKKEVFPALEPHL